jgi:hopene-associated glycosyltransferase HpnB
MTDVLAIVCILVWVYLICARGRFWLGPVRDDANPPPPRHWPTVAVVIPARDEAAVIGAAVTSLLRQDYPGPLSVIVVDDDSRDGTAQIAAAAGPVAVVQSGALPAGWTGKLWAVRQGIATAEITQPDFVLLTDADIVHAPDTVAWLVRQALAGGYVLTSLMAKLRCVSLAERSHVPAFVYFFQMVFPFAWASRRTSSTAAAAGGCMLVRADALRAAGGIEAIHNALIDDCALAARLKTVGPIWLGLTDRVRSIRPYETFADVKAMIARSAYAQLKFSPWLLAAATIAMAVTFIAPPLLAIFAAGFAQSFGAIAWLLVAVSFLPMLRFYRLSPLWSAALPVIAALYALYTLASAYDFARRRGGQWKGRVHVNAPGVS